MTAPTPSGIAAVPLSQFNQLDLAVAADLVWPCLHVERWVAAVVGARPYRQLDDLVRVARTAAQPFTAGELAAAVADRNSRDPWPPPAILDHADTAGAQGVAARQILGNAHRYAERFGQPFLVRKPHRSAQEILINLQIRLHNTRGAESRAVSHELRQIALLALTATITT